MNNEVLIELLNEIKTLHEKIDVLEKKLEEKNLEPLVYDTKQLAQVLGMSKNNAGILMANKSFPARKLGGKWKVTKDELDLWLRQTRNHEIDFAK